MPTHTRQTKQIKTSRRRTSTRIPITQSEAKQLALQINHNPLPQSADLLIAMLASYGSMTYEQVQIIVRISKRTLRRYQFDHLIDTIQTPSFDCKLGSSNLTYKLGMVGLEVARNRRLVSPTRKGYDLRKIRHDLLCNQVVTSVVKQAGSLGVDSSWYGAYESRLYQKGDVVIEPDALLKIGDESKKDAYAVEYHNEDDRRRVADKIHRYEKVFHSQLWRDGWGGSKMPVVLIAFTQKIVMDGYVLTLREMGGGVVRCTYLAKSIRNATTKPREIGQWANLNHKAFSDQWQTVDLFAGL